MFEIYMLIFLAIINIVIIFLAKIPLLNIVVGCLTVTIGALSLPDRTNIPYNPYVSLFVMLLGALALLAAAINLRSGD